ncbi:uncharacterized protein LOC131216680 [Anopheles bellator]|uniref:uncharacterized protein LOC131216680 n=1 Tax=Anopheles bellator TaxID=139047 RepID=UPI0026497E42|nr:uncharacterized protein LOC131216680 [Anopheles bellator]
METEADLVKVLAAYRINNQQLVRGIQQCKLNLRLSEERFNETNACLLEVRQENKFLRESLRKLTDQLKMITKTMVSVQDRTESIFLQINQNHELAETSELLRQPQAQYVYDRRRLERPPVSYVDTIPEEEHEESVPADDPSNAVASVTINETSEEDDLGRETDVTIEPPSAYAHYTSDSSLIQRLHLKSKSNSFDESFETIEPNRVLEVCRRSQERRRLYAGLQEGRQSDHTALDMDCEVNDDADKTASDTTLQATIKPRDDASVNDMTVFNPDDMMKVASCSTPVVKNPRCSGPQKAESDYRMQFLLDHPQPVVVLQPLTENNLKMHERSIVQNLDHNTTTQRRTSKRTRSNATRTIKNDSRRLEEESAQQSRLTVKSEQSSSTENLSDCSYRSGRPRRNAAPMNMREANLHTKLRRE